MYNLKNFPGPPFAVHQEENSRGGENGKISAPYEKFLATPLETRIQHATSKIFTRS